MPTALNCPLHLGPCDGPGCAWWVREIGACAVCALLFFLAAGKEVIVRDVELGVDRRNWVPPS